MFFKVLAFVALISTSFSIKSNENLFLNEVNNNDNSKVIYVDISLNESLIDSNIYLHYVNGENESNIDLILDDYDIYHSEISISFSNDGYYEIVNDDNSYISKHLDNNILKQYNYNYICLDNNNDDLSYGYYGNRLTNPGATYKTQRIFLENNNQDFYIDDDWSNKRVNAVGYYFNNSWNVIEMSYITNVYNNINYYYADIPFNVSSVHFMALANSEHHNYLTYLDYKVEQLSYGVCYNIIDDSDNVTTKVVEGAEAPLLALVVESYLTYGKNDSNGATSNTMVNVFNTWFKNKSASSSDLKNTKIADYTGYSSNGNSYEGLEKNSYFSVNEKWNTMCSQAGIDPKTGKKRSFINLSFLDGNTGKFMIIVGGVSFLVVGASIALIIFRKKKEQ